MTDQLHEDMARALAPLSDEIRTIRFGFPDKERQEMIEELARKVKALEIEVSRYREAKEGEEWLRTQGDSGPSSPPRTGAES